MTGISEGSFWLPRQLSTLAPATDHAFSVAMWISVFFFCLVVGALIYMSVRFRKRGDGVAVSQLDHHIGLELLWTGLPLVFVMGMFWVGYQGYLDAAVAPLNAMEIQVTAAKWSWNFTYANGATSTGELHIPKGRPVKLIMSSRDVIHSFFVPEFRVKKDVIPGRYTTIWFQATELGEAMLECAEYCGAGHSDMLGKVIVEDDATLREWMNSHIGGDDKLPPVELGKKQFVARSCNTCHSLDGSHSTGPSFKGVFGRKEALEGGSSVVVDENYIRESITAPAAKLVKGYPAVMPVFKGVLTDKQIDSLIAFIKAQK